MPKNARGGEKKLSTIKKAIEMSDAKITFVSLVDKAANKRQFLITKADGDKASFSSIGKILKVDDTTHYIKGNGKRHYRERQKKLRNI